MSFNAPEAALLDECTIYPGPCTSTLIQDGVATLQNFDPSLQHVLQGKSSLGTESPVSSSSTLTLEDDEIKRIFASEKLVCDTGPYAHRPGYHGGEGDDLKLLVERARTWSISNELNPQAKEFVPGFLNTKETIPKSRLLLRPIPGPGLQPRLPRWRRTFQRAVSTAAVSEQGVLSQVIATSDPWESATLAELAQEFAWRGAEDNHESASSFARAVYRTFQYMKSQDTADTFLWHLKEVVLGVYISVWDVIINQEAISYAWEPSHDHVKAAIGLGRFIGDLYTHELITPSNVTACLNSVLRNVISIEHVEAIQALITHAGPSYWLYNGEGMEGISRFRSVLVTVANQVKNETSVLKDRRPVQDREVRDVVNDILTFCDKSADQLLMAIADEQQAQFMPLSDSITPDPFNYPYSHMLL